MVNHLTDRVLVNPTHAQIAEAVEAANDRANAGARSRTAELGGLWAADEVFEAADGFEDVNGGGVPNSYRQRAETTVVGVAWWTAPSGVLHVRVYGNRVPAPKSAYGVRGAKVFREDAHPAARVYEGLDVSRMPKKDRREAEYPFREMLAADPLDVATRAAYADWLSERPAWRQGEAERQRKALALAVSLAGTPAAV